MTAEQYKKWTGPFVRRERLTRLLLITNQILTWSCYVLFPFLLILEYFSGNQLWARSFWTAGLSFLIVSFFRRIYNRPRPYEELDIIPLIQKDTKGKSFPSRHVFSVFVIAMCWFYYMPFVGIVLMISGCIMAYIRVIGGVHYPVDVIAGAIVGILSGLIGFHI